MASRRSRARLAVAVAGLAASVLVAGCTVGAAQPAARRSAAQEKRAPAAPSPDATGPAGTGSAAAAAAGTGSATPAIQQVITVFAASYLATYARLTAYQRTGGRWVRVFGPWTARIGSGGMAPPGRKREGDLRTPSGTYAFGFFFGAEPDPGVTFRYRNARPYDVWDDDPASPLYNEWVDERYQDPGAAPEPMDVSGYDYGAVIAYNTARTPGLGSAIFLHVNIGSATTGCVTLPMGELLKVLRWLSPRQSPRIVLGVATAQ
jgi:L,D-peptidoglycan transpeptidase YkuD (ErfK/YbiS/YcfS/YnhG family)